MKDLDLPEAAWKNDTVEGEPEGCVVIEPYAEVNGKWKANMFYNMQRRCHQKLIRHTNRTIKITNTAKFD